MQKLIPSNGSSNRRFPPILVDRLESEFSRKHADDDKLFREEFAVSVVYLHRVALMRVCSVFPECSGWSRQSRAGRQSDQQRQKPLHQYHSM